MALNSTEHAKLVLVTADKYIPAFFGPAVSFISIERFASSRSTSRILE